MEENKSSGSKTKSRIKAIVYWVTTSIIVLESAAGAQWDLSRNEFVTKVFIHLGYPLYLLTIIGVWKIPAVIALLVPKFPRVKEWAYAGLFFVYSGAAASHFAVNDPASAWLGPLIFCIFIIISWAFRPSSRRLPGPNF